MNFFLFFFFIKLEELKYLLGFVKWQRVNSIFWRWIWTYLRNLKNGVNFHFCQCAKFFIWKNLFDINVSHSCDMFSPFAQHYSDLFLFSIFDPKLVLLFYLFPQINFVMLTVLKKNIFWHSFFYFMKFINLLNWRCMIEIAF